MIYLYFEIKLKTNSFLLPYQQRSSLGDCPRELFKTSKDLASLQVAMKKNSDCGFRVVFWVTS